MPTHDHHDSNAIYEVIESRASRERWAVLWEDGHLAGTLDLTGEPIPEAGSLPDLTYFKPEKGDAERLKQEGTTWVILKRFTRFMSAMPPQWVLDRQSRTRSDTVRPVNKTLIDRGIKELDF